MGQGKDRENIWQLLLWAKNYLLLIRIDSGSAKQRQTLNQQFSSTLSSQAQLHPKFLPFFQRRSGGLANGGCGAPSPSSHFSSVPVWALLMVCSFLQGYPSTCSRMRSSAGCREIPAPARVLHGLQGSFCSCTCSTFSFFCIFALS